MNARYIDISIILSESATKRSITVIRDSFFSKQRYLSIFVLFRMYDV